MLFLHANISFIPDPDGETFTFVSIYFSANVIFSLPTEAQICRTGRAGRVCRPGATWNILWTVSLFCWCIYVVYFLSLLGSFPLVVVDGLYFCAPLPLHVCYFDFHDTESPALPDFLS